jgi:very-short-patch-repair endonuclease
MAHRRFFNRSQQRERRRDLRSSLTPAEAALWRLLQGGRLKGRKFRRQHGIGPYVVDFYCPHERLVVELEGAAHDSETAAVRDRFRERFLADTGLTVLRLENRSVFENPEGVLELIAGQFRKG